MRKDTLSFSFICEKKSSKYENKLNDVQVDTRHTVKIGILYTYLWHEIGPMYSQ